MSKLPKLSRQSKHQHKKHITGKCWICPRKAVDGWFCKKHKLVQAIASRNRYRKKVGIPIDAPLYTKAK